MRPVSFRPGAIEYESVPGAPANLAQRLVGRLKEWTGERWLPLFLLVFNEVDGGFYPLSDVGLTTEVVKEYNLKKLY